MRFVLSVLIALSLLAAMAVAAAPANNADRNRFKWRDAGGNLHYGDALPTDAATLGYDVVNPRGLVIKHVDRAKTSAELAAAKAAEAKAQAEKAVIDAQARADAQLLSGYPQESDLKRAQQQQRDMLDQQVGAARISLRSQEQTLADLLGRAADAERSNKKIPDEQARQLATVRKQVDAQRLTVERRENERKQADVRFQSETQRYRQLKAAQATNQSK